MRCSLYVEGNSGERVVIDTGPEFRLQALNAGIGGLDAVFLTHTHADHIHGLDDIRPLSWEKTIPIYGSNHAKEEFEERFSYIFRETQRGGGKPKIEFTAVNRPVLLGGLILTPIPIMHGNIAIFGWKITENTNKTACGLYSASIVYLTDCSYISENSYALIAEKGPPEIAIIGGLRKRSHSTHFNFEEALYAGIKIGAKKVFLTHICHDYSHREIEEYCANFCQEQATTAVLAPAWDGLELGFEATDGSSP